MSVQEKVRLKGCFRFLLLAQPMLCHREESFADPGHGRGCAVRLLSKLLTGMQSVRVAVSQSR